MKRMLFAFLASAGALVGVAVGPAHGQPRSPGISPQGRPSTNSQVNPVFSPYLNFLNRSNSAFFNYYGFVQPQLQGQQAVNMLEQQIQTNQQNIRRLENRPPEEATAGDTRGIGRQQSPSLLPPTGRPVGFLTQGQFYGRPGAGSTGGATAGSSGLGGVRYGTR